MYSTFVTSLHILANAFIGLRSDVTNRLKLPCILVSYCIKLKLRCQPQINTTLTSDSVSIHLTKNLFCRNCIVGYGIF